MQQIDRCWKWRRLVVSLTNILLDSHLLWHDIQSQWLKQSIATIITAPCQPRLHHANTNLWCTRRKANQFYVISLNNQDHNHSLSEWKLGTEKPDITLSNITQYCTEHPDYWGRTFSSGFEFKWWQISRSRGMSCGVPVSISRQLTMRQHIESFKHRQDKDMHVNIWYPLFWHSKWVIIFYYHVYFNVSDVIFV